MQAAHARVPVVSGTQPPRPHGCVEAGHVLGQPLRRDRRVLDERGGLGVPPQAHQQPQTPLAHAPHATLLRLLPRDHGRERAAFAHQVGAQLLDLPLHLLHPLPCKLDQQQRPRVSLHELDQLPEPRAFAATLDDGVVHQLHRRRLVRVRPDRRCRGLHYRPEMQRRQHLHCRDGHDPHGRFGNRRERPLRPHYQLGEVERAVLPHLVEVVAGDTPQDLREALLNLRPMLARQRPHAPVDVALETLDLASLRRLVLAQRSRVAGEPSASTTSSAITLSTVLP